MKTILKKWNDFLDRAAGRRILQAMVRRTGNFENTRWLGRPMWQFPLGAWVLQEVISELKPDLIVETGTHRGGSAFYFASLCDLLSQGEVISIDIQAAATPEHPRISYWKGSSIDPEIVARVKKRIAEKRAGNILIILDSNHSREHVARELEAYAPLVPEGSYIHVQDGSIDELPCFRRDGAGPKAAALDFLKKDPSFKRDLEIEKRYEITFHPCGWLKKVRMDKNGSGRG